MAVDVRTRTEEERAEVNRTLGGNLMVWLVGLLLGLGLFVLSVGLAPSIGGFALMAVSGVVAGVSYTEVMLRMPTVTHRFTLSLLLALLAAAAIVTGSLVYGQSLPTRPQNSDINLLPTSGSS